MLISRIHDLYRWGYEEYALKYALFLLINYGETDQGKLIKMVKSIHNDSSVYYSWRQRVMLIILKISPFLSI